MRPFVERIEAMTKRLQAKGMADTMMVVLHPVDWELYLGWMAGEGNDASHVLFKKHATYATVNGVRVEPDRHGIFRADEDIPMVTTIASGKVRA